MEENNDEDDSYVMVEMEEAMVPVVNDRGVPISTMEVDNEKKAKEEFTQQDLARDPDGVVLFQILGGSTDVAKVLEILTVFYRWLGNKENMDVVFSRKSEMNYTSSDVSRAVVDTLTEHHPTNVEIHLQGLGILHFLVKEDDDFLDRKLKPDDGLDAPTFTRCALFSLNQHGTEFRPKMIPQQDTDKWNAIVSMQLEALAICSLLTCELSTQPDIAEWIGGYIRQRGIPSETAGDDEIVLQACCHCLHALLSERRLRPETLHHVARSCVPIASNYFWSPDSFTPTSLLQVLKVLTKCTVCTEHRQFVYPYGTASQVRQWVDNMIDDAAVQLWYTSLLGNFASDPKLVRKMNSDAVDVAGLDSIFRARKRHPDHRPLRQAFLGALNNLARTNGVLMMKQDRMSAIGNAMKQILQDIEEAGSDQEIQRQQYLSHLKVACMLVNTLGQGLDYNMTPFLWQECLRTLIQILQQHPDQEALHPYILSTLANSALDTWAANTNHRFFLIEHDAIQLTFAAMSRFLANVEIQDAGCHVINNLSLCSEGEDLVVSLGGIDILVAALQCHTDQTAVLHSGLLALAKLATTCEKTRSSMRRAGVIPLVRDALKFLGEKKTVESSNNSLCNPKPMEDHVKAREYAEKILKNICLDRDDGFDVAA